MLEFTPSFDPYEKLLQHQREIADLQHNQVVLANEINNQLRLIQQQQREIIKLQHFIHQFYKEAK
jgi:hypothetical protein